MGIVGKSTKVGSIHAPTFLAFSLSQLINAMSARHLRNSRHEGHSLISCLQHTVQFQKDFCRRILGVFSPLKEMPADPQDVAIVSRVDRACVSEVEDRPKRREENLVRARSADSLHRHRQSSHLKLLVFGIPALGHAVGVSDQHIAGI
jgi:hypothetical protein